MLRAAFVASVLFSAHAIDWDDTWKNIEKAKNDASTIHETLLEKLENGQYYTSTDIEETLRSNSKKQASDGKKHVSEK